MAASKKNSKQKSADRFAYFSKNIDEFDLGSSDSDDDTDEQPRPALNKCRDISFITKPTVEENYDLKSESACLIDDPQNATASKVKTDLILKSMQALPSASDVLKNTSKPDFLGSDLPQLNWDKLVKNKLAENTEIDVSKINTNSVPPPASYESQSEPLKPTLGDTSVFEQLKRHTEEDGENATGKRMKVS